MKVLIGPFRKKKERKIKIHIDEYDTWSMDHTLALIALPMLKQLRDTAHGSAMVDLEDVPPELRYTGYGDWDSQRCFDFYHEDDKDDMIHVRWMWVLDEMIFAMQHIVNDDDSQFYDESEVNKKDPFPDQLRSIKCDYPALYSYYERIDNGCRLFGKYYRSLWD